MTTPTPAAAHRSATSRRLAVVALLAAVFSANTLSTWNLWGDAIIDCGRELDVPLQLSQGKILYRDVRYWYGPLAPTLNSWLYAACGAHTQTLTSAGLIVAALMTGLIYRTARLLADRLTATACAAAFLCTCAFAHLTRLNAFNFVLPYAFPTTYGILLATASVYFLLRHMLRGRSLDFAASAAGLAAASLTKIEPLFACVAAHALFVLLRLIARQPWRPVHLVGYAAALLTPVVTFGRFYAMCGDALWHDNLFLPGNLSANVFSLRHSGLDNPYGSLANVALSAAALIIACGMAALAQRWYARTVDARVQARGVFLVQVVAASPGVAVAAWLGTETVFAGAPLLLLAGAGVMSASWLRNGRSDTRLAAELVLTAFAGAAIARMLLQCQAGHYGFYLLPPALVALAVLGGRAIAPAGNSDRRGGRCAAAGVGSVAPALWLATLCIAHLVQSRATDAAVFGGQPRWAVGPRGRLPVQEIQAGAVDAAAAYLAQHARGARVVVLPEGAGLTFVAGASNPLGVHTFLPLDFSGQYSEAAMIQRLATANPEYAVITARNVSEYGAEGFGVDYARGIAEWLMGKYDIVGEFTTETYAVHVLRRR
ncbi:hypothetical protein RAS1_06460 [Phycisphaerae bacterium RAS1]|nr:hypothetical protein RAS1_06460 [Phycisphaerae bacterium RAS1]